MKTGDKILLIIIGAWIGWSVGIISNEILVGMVAFMSTLFILSLVESVVRTLKQKQD